VALVPFSGDNVISSIGDHDLFKFSVSANSVWDLGLAKFTFGVSTSAATVSPTGYRLFENTVSSGGTNTKLADTGDCTATLVGATNPQHLVECRFDVNSDNGDMAAGQGEFFNLSRGTTRYFTLQGNVTARSTTADAASISTVLAGDDAFASTSQVNFAGLDNAVDQDDFIWSDLHFESGYSSSTATKTAGWYNGYRVTGLDNNSSTSQNVQN